VRVSRQSALADEFPEENVARKKDSFSDALKQNAID